MFRKQNKVKKNFIHMLHMFLVSDFAAIVLQYLIFSPKTYIKIIITLAAKQKNYFQRLWPERDGGG